MTARDFLAAVQQRADAATNGPWDAVERAGVYIPFPWGAVKAHVETDANAEFIAASRTDVPRLVAALGGVIELIEAWEVGPDVGYDQNETVELMVEKAHARELRAAITDALTPKENDS